MVGSWKEVFFLFSTHPFTTLTNQINDNEFELLKN